MLLTDLPVPGIIGDTTEFGPSGYLGRVDFKGVSYVKPEFASLPGTDLTIFYFI